MLVNKNLRFIRSELLGIKQEAMAEIISCSPKSVHAYETSLSFKRATDILVNYCDYFNSQQKIVREIGLLSPDRVINEDLRETAKKLRVKMEHSDQQIYSYNKHCVYSQYEGLYILEKPGAKKTKIFPGLDKFLNEDSRYKYNPTPEEIATLKVTAYLDPEATEEFFVNALIKLRKFKDHLSQQRTEDLFTEQSQAAE
jgi:DNA-binding XRE family transcriptional regulator